MKIVNLCGSGHCPVVKIDDEVQHITAQIFKACFVKEAMGVRPK